MTVKQAAMRLEVSLATVYALVAAGRLRCSRHGLGRGTIRISEEQLTEYVKSVEVAASPPAILSVRPAFRHVRLP